jgi:hypothetical protein
MTYSVLFAYFAFNALVEYYSRKKNTVYINSSYYISIFLLFFFAAFRYETGGDFPSYEFFFNEAGKGMRPLDLDLFYYYYNRVIYIVFNEFQFVYIFISLFTISVLNKYISIFSPIRTISVLAYFSMFYFIYDFIAVRQYISICLFLLGVIFGKKRIWIYFIFILIAAFFHFSAIILFPVIFFIRKQWDVTKLFLLFLILLIIYLLDLKLVGKFLIFMFDNLPDSVFSRKMNAYLFIGALAVKRPITGKTLVLFFIYIIGFFVARKEKSGKFMFSFNLASLYMFIYLGFYEYYHLSNRISYYFSVSFIIIISYIVNYLKSKKCFRNNFLLLSFMVIILFSYNKGIFLESPDYVAYNPYQSYLIYKSFNLKSTGKKRLEVISKRFREIQDARQ